MLADRLRSLAVQGSAQHTRPEHGKQGEGVMQ